MRIVAAAITGLAALVATTQAANACDLEGFGYTRMNPFAQHTAWNVPAEQQSQPQDKPAAASASSSDASPQPRQASTASPGSSAQAPAVTPVPAAAKATQSRRFTATKD
jgi:hypothetical protein